MRRHVALLSVCASLNVVALLSGCAALSAYHACGIHGCAGDANITAEVKGLLNQHPALGPPNQVYVQTLNHVVYLTGLVDTGLERQTAKEVATQAPGVTEVVNSIGVNNGG